MVVTAEPPIVREAEHVRTWGRLFVLLAAVAGVAALIGGADLAGAEGLLIGAALAAMFWCGAAYIHLRWLATPQPEKRTHRIEAADGSAAFRVDLRPHLPLSLLLGGIGMVVFFGVTGLVLGSTFWLVAGGLLSLLGLLPIPDAIRALTASERCAVLDPHGIVYAGYSFETRVAWDDVASVGFDDSNKNLQALRLDIGPRDTLTWTSRRWIARIEPTPTPNRLSIPLIVFDQPASLTAVCQGMIQTPADHRPRYLESVGTSMLTRPSTSHH